MVRKILSGVARAGERYGRRKIVAMLVGDTGDFPPNLAALSTMGLLRCESRETLDRWIEAAVDAGLIAVSPDQYRTLSLTAKGRGVMSGRTEGLQIIPPLRSPPLSYGRGFRSRRRPRRWGRFSEDW